MFISIVAILVFLPAAQAVDFGISGQGELVHPFSVYRLQ
jgi:hypothetical protein